MFGKGIPLTGITDAKHERYSEAAEVRARYADDEAVRKVIDTPEGWRG